MLSRYRTNKIQVEGEADADLGVFGLENDLELAFTLGLLTLGLLE